MIQTSNTKREVGDPARQLNTVIIIEETKGGTHMERNVGTIDRAVRLVVAILFIVANVAGWVTGIAGLVLAVLAGMLLSSVASGHCPLYVMLGIKKTI
jgi:hypothetical protein